MRREDSLYADFSRCSFLSMIGAQSATVREIKNAANVTRVSVWIGHRSRNHSDRSKS